MSHDNALLRLNYVTMSTPNAGLTGLENGQLSKASIILLAQGKRGFSTATAVS